MPRIVTRSLSAHGPAKSFLAMRKRSVGSKLDASSYSFRRAGSSNAGTSSSSSSASSSPSSSNAGSAQHRSSYLPRAESSSGGWGQYVDTAEADEEITKHSKILSKRAQIPMPEF
mmetsp:Transcript_38347/g.79741  ORF Transcript_38347/g.79741 Transcript_38347/m.79741 type:complete len:115 (-) Transcript_38347:1366-1710(-)